MTSLFQSIILQDLNSIFDWKEIPRNIFQRQFVVKKSTASMIKEYFYELKMWMIKFKKYNTITSFFTSVFF